MWDLDIQTIALLTAALGAGAIVKGATGLGLPLVALPLLATVVGLQQAIGILVIPLIITNAYQVWAYQAARSGVGLAFLPRFLIGGFFGIAIGTWALGTFPERQLEIALGVMLYAYIGLRFVKPDFSLTQSAAVRIGAPVGLAAGILQGATGIAAPIFVTFLHALGLARSASVFAVSVIFLGFSTSHFAALIIAGIYRADWILLSLFALVPIVALMPVGEWLGRRASPETFGKMILVFLAIVGAKMILGY